MILKDLNGKKIHISVYISDDKEIAKLNKKYRNKEYATDVLSFNINEELEDGTFYLGDVIVNKEQASRQAAEFGNNVEQEISELAGHGILHLLGVHHDGDDH
ncbi:rRNA maturation RNase YbeY [candidate division WWE3 bacterium]|uniref:Endoribonuclease YbeY n=1 Tax=candidate division WWE3 bacterium TaxID=2053526 RepID=A0A7X9HGZ7_UNCKA|nr:rRNA maturation RNase YbeY [candidate division WWE3 bacterium]